MIDAPPGEPSREPRLVALHTIVGAIEERGRLPPLGAVRRGHRGGVEVGQLVVEQEAVAGHDDAVAAGLLDRERVGDDVARASRRRSGASSSRPGPRWRRCPRASGPASPAVPLATAPAGAVGPMRANALGRVGRIEHARDRVADERRVAEVRVAVGVGEPRGLEVVVSPTLARLPGCSVLHDVQRLEHRRAAGGRRAHAVDVGAHVGQLHGARAARPCT